MALSDVSVDAAPLLAAAAVGWVDALGQEQLTAVVQAQFRLRSLDLAEPIAPDGVAELDKTPVKARADVMVLGTPRAPRSSRAVAGVAVARGAEILFGRRMVVSTIAGERSLSPLDGGPAGFGPAEPSARRDGELESGQRAALVQRMPFLRGGEQLLVVGFGADLWARLPALRPAALARVGRERVQVPLLGDTLVVDMERSVATVIWRGHVPLPAGVVTLAAMLVPLVEVEEVAGAPPSWERSLARRGASRPAIVGRPDLAAAVLAGAAREVVIVKACFDPVAAAPATLAATQEPLSGDRHEGDESSSLRYPSDFAPEKPAVDVVVTGSIYPRGAAASATSRLSIGSIDKQIVALGPRRWQRDGTPSAAEPFERVPLRYEVAFGGPASVDNPLGTGLEGTAPPSLENPRARLTSARQRAAPACFAPIPPRFALRDGGGSYDRDWLERRWPDFPADHDARAFQVAPLDQRCAHLRGDEAYRLTSVRPGGEDLAGMLPGLAAHAYAARHDGGFEAVPLRLDTVLFDCEAPKLTLLWRGALARGERASAVRRLWLCLAAVDEPPDAAHAWGELRGADDVRFVADADPAPPPATLAALRDQLARARIEVPSAAAEEWPASPRLRRAEVLAWLAAGETLAGRDMTGADLTEVDLSGRDLSGAVLAGARLDGARLDGARCRGASFAGVSAEGSSWAGADLTEADVTAARLARASFAGATLEGATFAGALLDGADLCRVTANRADLGGASLIGGRLDEAALVRADLSRAVLDRASLRGAKLDEARLYDASGEAAVFDGASLAGARLDGARLPRLSACDVNAPSSMWQAVELQGARLLRANLREASFNAAQLDDAALGQADARRARLRGASLRRASLLAADLMQADLEGADLGQADLRGANLYQAETRAARLDGAKLDLAHVAGTRLATK